MVSNPSPRLEDALPAAFSGSRVVVTGAAGFLGSHLCERLIAYGASAVGLDDLSTGRTRNLVALDEVDAFELLPHDVTLPLAVPGEVDHVFHLASPASPRDYGLAPVRTLVTGSAGTLHALTLAAQKQARIVVASTSEVYGDPLLHPQQEEHWGNVNPVGPRSMYDEAKRYAEALTVAFARTAQVSSAIVRIFNTYGPRMRPDDGRAVPTFIAQALTDQPLTVAGDGSQTRSLCFVDDTVTGLLALAASQELGPVNIGNPHEITMLQLAETIRRLTGSMSPIIHTELPGDDPRRRCPDITRARQLLGWEPTVRLEDGLSRTIDAARVTASDPVPTGGAR
ncbi:UDP-glucuronic acid decarboxylase family protein [Streptomyces fulvoviolaceus]|uniref:UDP-glucuronic acid decarboxylase family protein n=1 Tax=Streptomyces fulvoviolaceus TaxID=285535 RepID=UPI0021C25354|nr:UDP-glucuronic acid decarboxylase family protein [Streptomyces fulvoviolaceus]MCT9080450.1 SDR family oxidoreductase [Streptomyces fulvoviolaceus]